MVGNALYDGAIVFAQVQGRFSVALGIIGGHRFYDDDDDEERNGKGKAKHLKHL